MEELLPITNLNDFLFCPRSLYYGNIFRNSVGEDAYQQAPQKTGLAAHRTIDHSTYSSRKNVICGMMVYSEQFGLIGKIDVYDGDNHTLTERKWSVSAIWEGFRLQIHAQYFALCEMGFDVRELRLHSKKDNRTYPIPLPEEKDAARLTEVIQQMRSFRLESPFAPNPRKCANCIYREICDLFQSPEQEPCSPYQISPINK